MIRKLTLVLGVVIATLGLTLCVLTLWFGLWPSLLYPIVLGVGILIIIAVRYSDRVKA